MKNDIEETLKLLEFSPHNAEILKALSSTLEKELPVILTQFYRFLGEWENLRTMFRGQEGMDRAKNAQVTHWTRICTAEFGEDYVQSVRRIGLTHHRLNLEPKWYLGGYAFIVVRIVNAIMTDKRKGLFTRDLPPQEQSEMLEAFIKAVFLDMIYVISVYLDEGKEEKKRILSEMSARIETDIGGIVQHIASEVQGLETTATSLNDISVKTSQISTDVAAAAEEASANVNTVAAATEEISHSVAEMRNMVERSHGMTQDAVRQADEANTSVSSLVNAIGNIANMSDMIGDIAHQTNLLALNASIEAARAGDAGKGFAVVANEVKVLANQTAESTNRIASEIQDIQARSKEAMQSIATVIETINKISEYALNMTAGMQEQSLAIAEIARNVDEAATGTADVTRNIAEVSRMNKDTEAASTDVLHATKTMSEKAIELEKTLKTFLAGLEKA